jgi:hypothetical protein
MSLAYLATWVARMWRLVSLAANHRVAVAGSIITTDDDGLATN